MIFDHSHRIPQATHLLQLCSQDLMSRGSISFNYSYFNPIYTSAVRSFYMHRNSLFLRIYREKKSPYTKYSVFTKLSRATTSHLVCCCIKLWHQPVLIVSRPGEAWSFHFIFRFLVQVAQHPAKADNHKRCMMSCRHRTLCQNPVTKFPGSYHYPPSFPLLSFSLPLCLFSSSDNIQVRPWECTW